MNKWWGYIHENGTLHVKRFFGAEDIWEAEASPFVRSVAIFRRRRHMGG